MVDNNPQQQPQVPQVPSVGEKRPMVKFPVHLMIDGQMYPGHIEALNELTAVALLSIAVSANLPRMSGFTLWSPDGKEPIASVPAVEFLGNLGEGPLKKEVTQVGSGWRAMPLVTGTSPDFQQEIKKAKNEGRA